MCRCYINRISVELYFDLLLEGLIWLGHPYLGCIEIGVHCNITVRIDSIQIYRALGSNGLFSIMCSELVFPFWKVGQFYWFLLLIL